MADENYKGVLWPIRMQSDGNLVTGTRRETIRSDLKLTIQTRRFVNKDTSGERPFEPDIGTLFPGALLSRFDPSVFVPVSRAEIVGVFQFFEREKLVRLAGVSADRPLEGALRLVIFYDIFPEDFRDNYAYEVPPPTEALIRTRG